MVLTANQPVVGIIGAGNMGTCLITGLIRNGHDNKKIWASSRTENKLIELQKQFHINVNTDNQIIAKNADVVIIAVKPKQFREVTNEIKEIICQKKTLLISVAAGIRIQNITESLCPDLPIARAMPNTPAKLTLGATAIYANAYVTDKERQIIEDILQSIGITVWVDKEDLLDVVTALSGSGPAYFFLLMECLQRAAEELGLSKEIANKLVLQTAIGAAHMAVESEDSLQELRRHVTSPGGTTEKAISVLEKHNFEELLKKMLATAAEHAKEMASKY